MHPLKSLLIRSAANARAQSALQWLVDRAQFLMGIGAGAGMDTSAEHAVLRHLRERAPQPWCIFDVGANRGQFLQLLRQELDGYDYAVHGFEPGRRTFALLQQAAGADSRVRLNRLAIGRQPGCAQLHYDAAGSGLASLTRRRLDHFDLAFTQSEPVEITTLDAYCAQHSIGRIDLLKLDIEGHELDALQGSRQMLEQGRVGLIVFEFGGCNIDTRTFLQDFWYLFQELGYTLHRLTPGGDLHPLPAYRESLEQFRTTHFVAMPRSLTG